MVLLLHKFLKLGIDDYFLVFKTFLLLNLVRLGLLLVPFRSLQQWALNTQPKTSSPHHSVSKMTWAVRVCSRYSPGGALCLAQALTTQVLMQRSGYGCTLKIGVTNPQGAKFEAHAWIEYEGTIIIGNLPDLARFTPLI
jgi:Transglutaminase-like superfamily